jgi:hypothetical protein
MAKYDDASWHYLGEFPKNLPKINGATHIGIFLEWCIQNDLMSEEQIEDFYEDILKVKESKMSGVDYLINNCDEVFSDNDLNYIGNSFTNDYYEGDSEFSKSYSDYKSDYCQLLDTNDNETIYHIENTPKNRLLMKNTIDKRFIEWNTFIKNFNN